MKTNAILPRTEILRARAPLVTVPRPPFERENSGRPVLPIRCDALYRFGHLIRIAESLLLKLFSQGLLSGTVHTALGQELCQMGVVRALQNPEDVVLSNHRNHGHFLTYSGDLLGLISEIMGREAGVCGGRGGSQHIASGRFHSNGVQGGMTGIAVGHGLGIKLRGGEGMVAVMVGDGTLGQGLLYESLNLASVWEVPVLFVVENNGIAQTTPTAWTTGGSIAARGAAFGLRTWTLDDGQPDFFERAAEVVAEVRAARAPGFLVIDTRRLGPHSKGDDLRTSAEMDAIRNRDPLARLGAHLADQERAAIERRNEEYLAEILDEAKHSPEAHFARPPRSLFDFWPCDSPAPLAEGAREEGPQTAAVTVRSSLNAAQRSLLRRRPDVILLGEDLFDPYGGAFKVTAGLSTEFPERVRVMPISEAGVIGSAIGLALEGYRPIAEVMFADFLTLGLDQLYNHAVKFPALSGHSQVPLVVRTPSGGRRGYGPTHSQSPENIATSIPGLTVLFPSNRHNCGRLLETVVDGWPYPTVFFEHKLLYGVPQQDQGYEAAEADPLDRGGALFPTMVRVRTNPDLSILTYGGMLPVVEEAVRVLEEEEELSCEIVVPALLSPLPKATLGRLLARRSRIVIAEESHSDFGVGAEFAAVLAEAGFHGRLLRVGTPPVPIPAARSLEMQVIPGAAEIVRGCLSLF